jgi:hypothetical protein
MFYITNKKIKNFSSYEWKPTIALLDKCQLKYENDIPQLEMILILTKQKVGRFFAK